MYVVILLYCDWKKEDIAMYYNVATSYCTVKNIGSNKTLVNLANYCKSPNSFCQFL